MKIRFLNIKISTIAVLSAYLFSQVAHASMTKDVDNSLTQTQQVHIVDEISIGFAELLADLGVTDVKPQAHRQLRHSITEEHAADALKQATDQLPTYKFKVIITE
tara:strand:- start:2142 stop:2456 length:315 start_codon:yes stop_codon:yes gene_type:complete